MINIYNSISSRWSAAGQWVSSRSPMIQTVVNRIALEAIGTAAVSSYSMNDSQIPFQIAAVFSKAQYCVLPLIILKDCLPLTLNVQGTLFLSYTTSLTFLPGFTLNTQITVGSVCLVLKRLLDYYTEDDVEPPLESKARYSCV